MIHSHLSQQFRRQFGQLPVDVQRDARNAYRLFKSNPRHPSLRFKQLEGLNGFYSVRIGLHYRAVGQLKHEDLLWFWIGSHTDFDKMF